MKKVRLLRTIGTIGYDGMRVLWFAITDLVGIRDLITLIRWIIKFLIFEGSGGTSDPSFLTSAYYVILATFEFFRRFGLAVMTLVIGAYNLPAFEKASIAVVELRDDAQGRARKAALPQRSGKRIFRRKVSRL